MKRYLAATAVLVVFLMISLPFASSAPDGLQRVASSFGIKEPEPFWRGLMGDYAMSFLGDAYVSELAAGVLGTVFVLLAAIVLGTLIVRRVVEQPQRKSP